jgi:hypothetical protein
MDWMDLCGLVAPAQSVRELEKGIEDGSFRTVEDLSEALAGLSSPWAEKEWGYCVTLLRRLSGADMPGKEFLIRTLEEGKAAGTRLREMAIADAAKDEEERSRIGYGMDGAEDERNADFFRVRGKGMDAPIVGALREEIHRIAAASDALIRRLASTK